MLGEQEAMWEVGCGRVGFQGVLERRRTVPAADTRGRVSEGGKLRLVRGGWELIDGGLHQGHSAPARCPQISQAGRETEAGETEAILVFCLQPHDVFLSRPVPRGAGQALMDGPLAGSLAAPDLPQGQGRLPGLVSREEMDCGVEEPEADSSIFRTTQHLPGSKEGPLNVLDGRGGHAGKRGWCVALAQ